MDLRSIINTEGGDSSIPKQAAPVTPIQAPPGQGFREYNHHPQASPGKHPSQDYSSQPGGPYASPTAYQGSSSTYQGQGQGRPPPPPPIQAPPQNQNDLRSPARSYSAQSPYQHTPSSSSTNQYPFPQSQTPQSPAQHQQQYPPSFPQRDSYAQPNAPPHLQHHNSQSHGSPAPQTPPIGIPGAPHSYLQHQRSQSSLSAGTPTSAQSQQPYYNQYSQDSPVSTSHFPPSQIPQHQRQQSLQSQPGTPLGPPLTQRQSSGGFVQPTSPYQQRGLSSGPFSNFQQTSPAPPPPASIPRQPSTPSAYDSQRTSTSEHQRRSQSERERSISVSPKTRLPSQTITTPQSENGYVNHTKRKMADREPSIEELQTAQYADVKLPVNGDHRTSQSDTLSPRQPPKKRMRYTEPPIWAQSIKSKPVFASRNKAPAKTNGKQPDAAFHQNARPETNGNRQVSPAVSRPGTIDAPPDPTILLGPWDKCITGAPPFDQHAKGIADFLYNTVVSRGDIGELSSRGVEIEIEAKLGQIIDKETNHRLILPVRTVCILEESSRMAFRSSMTEAQHSKLNDFLNGQVTATHPGNPAAKGRVPIQYLHRRETDKFYDLPQSMLDSLPAIIRERVNPRQVKVRVSYDQKTNNMLAKIIKARIADLSIHNPQSDLDCRISVNFELRFDGDIEEIIAAGVGERHPDRHKDRLSYTQGPYQIDLTQVTQNISTNGNTRIDKEHELEIEVSTEAVREQGQRAASGRPHEYPALVEGLLNNILVLAREIPVPWTDQQHSTG